MHGLLEGTKLECYYHPQVSQGFTKRRNLYGLGVVLCEIGCWRLIADSVSGDKKKEMISREKWREFLLKNVVVDLRWRMGERYSGAVKVLLQGDLPDNEAGDEIFTQQFLENVILHLSTCTA